MREPPALSCGSRGYLWQRPRPGCEMADQMAPRAGAGHSLLLGPRRERAAGAWTWDSPSSKTLLLGGSRDLRQAAHVGSDVEQAQLQDLQKCTFSGGGVTLVPNSLSHPLIPTLQMSPLRAPSLFRGGLHGQPWWK